MAKKRNNRRTVEEQVEVAPRSCRPTPALPSVSALRTRVGINALCQEQSFVSGENLFLFLRPAYQTRVWGAGAQQEPLIAHQCAVQRLRPFLVYICFLFRVTLTAQRIQHQYISNRCCAVGCLRVLCTLVRFRRFASAGSCITLLKVSSSIWTARHSSLARRVRTKPEVYSSFL